MAFFMSDLPVIRRNVPGKGRGVHGKPEKMSKVVDKK
jgi:hypothetical protein